MAPLSRHTLTIRLHRKHELGSQCTARKSGNRKRAAHKCQVGTIEHAH